MVARYSAYPLICLCKWTFSVSREYTSIDSTQLCTMSSFLCFHSIFKKWIFYCCFPYPNIKVPSLFSYFRKLGRIASTNAHFGVFPWILYFCCNNGRCLDKDFDGTIRGYPNPSDFGWCTHKLTFSQPAYLTKVLWNLTKTKMMVEVRIMTLYSYSKYLESHKSSFLEVANR